MSKRRLPSELYLPFDVPTLRQADIEKGRNMNASQIKVGPFMRIRSTPNLTGNKNIRKIVCLHCPSMVGGESLQEHHWTVYAPDLADALIKADAHIQACHNGHNGDM